MRQVSDNKFRALSRGTATKADRQVAHSVFARLNDELFTLSQQEARTAAKIVFRATENGFILVRQVQLGLSMAVD